MGLASSLVVILPLMTAPDGERRSIREAADAEALRLAEALPQPQPSKPARAPNWVERHPVGTAAIVAGLSCFAIGWAMGDDGVFDDFTGEANGLFLGGICAGGAASIAGILRAVTRQPRAPAAAPSSGARRASCGGTARAVCRSGA